MFLVVCYYGVLWPASMWSALGWWALLMDALTTYYAVYFIWNAGEITRTKDTRTKKYIENKHESVLTGFNDRVKQLTTNNRFTMSSLPPVIPSGNHARAVHKVDPAQLDTIPIAPVGARIRIRRPPT